MDVNEYLSRFERAERITEGMSGDEKYRCTHDGKEYLLRIADSGKYGHKKREYEYLEHLNKAGLPVPGCVEFAAGSDGKVFTLLSWVPGEQADKALPGLSRAEQYGIGLQAGDILRRIHESSPAQDAAESWYDRYSDVMEPRFEAFRREGERFEGSDMILRYIEENKHLLGTRELCRQHGDYHTGNLILNGGKIWVIDWHTVDFDNIGDPWYEFNRIGSNFPMFAKGQIDGYFPGGVPDEFWRLFALYLSASAITSVVWARYRAPEEYGNIIRLNKSVLKMFDNMNDPIPRWYRDHI